MLCSWDRTVCWGGGVTRKDRCKLSMAANFITLRTAQNTTACTDSVSQPSQHRLTVSDFLLAAFICRDIFTFLPLSLIFITADGDVVSALKDRAKVHPREGRKDVIFEKNTSFKRTDTSSKITGTLSVWRCSYLNMQHIKQSVEIVSPILPLHYFKHLRSDYFFLIYKENQKRNVQLFLNRVCKY